MLRGPCCLTDAMEAKRTYVDTPAGQIHCWHAAGTGVPVVFLHQTASSGAMWLKVMTALGPGRPMIAFDTPGFGGSFDPPDAAPSIGDFAGWIAGAMQALKLPPVHLVGHHTGACVGVELAAGWPASVASLALSGPLPLTAAERDEYSKVFGAPFAPTPSGSYLLEAWEYLRSAGAGADLTMLNRELSDTLRAYPTRSKAYAAVWNHDFTTRLLEVSCPLQLLCAPDDVLYPYFERACQLRPDADAHALRGGANFAPDLAPDELAGHLSNHFASVERRVGTATPP
jgi:pimeloyl-ACP methyl ester carboxylesterase